MTLRIKTADSDQEITSCFLVMAELRPHLQADEFSQRVKRQQSLAGYRLAFVEAAGDVKAVAGFRTSESLAWGKHVYVDDLVTKSGERSRGYGKALFDWLVAYAKEQGCDQLHLDSGVQRFPAHRFYLTNRMDITSHHFALKLK
jgi:GNAT superfamily N-acetyltransferase